MGLVETLTIGVGAGVAKGVLKVWLKEDPISAGVGDSLLDIVKCKTSDKLEQQKTEKQFEQVAKKSSAEHQGHDRDQVSSHLRGSQGVHCECRGCNG